LHTKINVPHRYLNADTVTHPSTYRAQRRLTPLIKTNALRHHYARPPPPRSYHFPAVLTQRTPVVWFFSGMSILVSARCALLLTAILSVCPFVRPSVCLSVCLSLCHTRSPRLNGSRYRTDMFRIVRHSYAKATGEITQSLGLLGNSRSFKVTDFCTNRKLMCDLLLVINSNL